MKTVTVPEYIIKEAKDALRMAANHLGSRMRVTAMDRSIEYSERLLTWVLEGQIGEPPSVIPKQK